MPIQSVVGVGLAFRRETTFGTIATNDATARAVPYVGHTLSLSKSAIESEEIRPDFQTATMRHGNRAVGGDLQLQLQTGTYSPLMESALRRDFTTVTALAALTNVAAASVGNGGTFTRAAGSWITDGLRVGMCVRMTGWTTTAAANNARNYTIVTLTATVMTVAEAVVTKAAGDSVVVSVPGRVTFIPSTGHTQSSYTVEEWNPDVPRSNRFLGCRVNTMAINAQPNARADLTFGLLGRDRGTAASRYFTSAVTPAAAVMQVGHNGLLVVNGTPSGIVTGFELNLTNNMEVGAAVGSNLTPDVFHGRMVVNGRLTAYFDNTTLDDVFDLESEIGLVLRVSDDTSVNSNFLQITLPRIKLAGGSYSTANQSRVQSFDFTALRHEGTSGNEATTLMLQDGSLT
ncbi:MAG: hypothetical protein IOD11_18880 [Rhodocyclaceae bacterium]|nr:hypothetical protein [Rhodocyclaceae bacterium]